MFCLSLSEHCKTRLSCYFYQLVCKTVLQTVSYIIAHVFLPSPTTGPAGSQSSRASESGEWLFFTL